MTQVEMFNRGMVSVHDPLLDDTVRFSSYDEYEKYLDLIKKAENI